MPGDDRQTYRKLIDELVRECRSGQGSIGPSRVRKGLWNANADAGTLPEQHEINLLLARLSQVDREVIAGMLEGFFVSGVHTALVVLHEAEIPPFDDAYEGTPFHDFVGRLDGWEWPG